MKTIDWELRVRCTKCGNEKDVTLQVSVDSSTPSLNTSAVQICEKCLWPMMPVEEERED